MESLSQILTQNLCEVDGIANSLELNIPRSLEMLISRSLTNKSGFEVIGSFGCYPVDAFPQKTRILRISDVGDPVNELKLQNSAECCNWVLTKDMLFFLLLRFLFVIFVLICFLLFVPMQSSVHVKVLISPFCHLYQESS